jgi:hypothetical protein
MLIVLAGVASVAASVQRWWPECRLGELESLVCGRLQDHLYDYFAPRDPWVPIGSAATLAGVSALSLALGLTMLVPVHAVQRELRLVTPVLVVLALGMLREGAATLVSGLAGRPMQVPLLGLVGSSLEIVVPFALATFAYRLRHTRARWWSWRGPAPLLSSLFLAYPLVEFFLLPASHDTPAWSGALSGLCMVLAGWAAWWVPGRSTVRRATEAGAALPAC